MSDGSKIEWTEASWNPVTGCTEVSPGCDHCYAKTFAERWRGIPGHHFEQGFDVVLRPERLDQPLRWRRPRRIFVNSMSDLFHDKVPDEYVAQVFATMALSEQHTFQVLTKRHGRMRSLLRSDEFRAEVLRHALLIAMARGINSVWASRAADPDAWPFRNIWLGVSVENQQWADIRIPALLETPAAVRWISAEPLLGPVDLSRWLTVGGSEFGKDGPARVPFDDQKAVQGREECLHVADPRHLPGSDGLPPAPLGPVRVPTDTTAVHRFGQPADQFRCGAVDGGNGGVLPISSAPPLQIAFSVEQSGYVTQGPRVSGHLNPGGAESLPLPAGNASGMYPSANGLSGNAELLADLSDGQAGGVRTDQVGRADAGVSHSRHSTRAPKINWIVCGGESGPGARPMHPDWARGLRDACTSASVPFFFKQWGEWGPAPWRLDRGPDESVEAYKARAEALCATHAYAVWADRYGHEPYQPPHRPWSSERVELSGGDHAPMRRWGKKAAGRLLDGRTWDEYPEPSREVSRA